jgi:hypothetical protein
MVGKGAPSLTDPHHLEKINIGTMHYLLWPSLAINENQLNFRRNLVDERRQMIQWRN